MSAGVARPGLETWSDSDMSECSNLRQWSEKSDDDDPIPVDSERYSENSVPSSGVVEEVLRSPDGRVGPLSAARRARAARRRTEKDIPKLEISVSRPEEEEEAEDDSVFLQDLQLAIMFSELLPSMKEKTDFFRSFFRQFGRVLGSCLDSSITGPSPSFGRPYNELSALLSEYNEEYDREFLSVVLRTLRESVMKESSLRLKFLRLLDEIVAGTPGALPPQRNRELFPEGKEKSTDKKERDDDLESESEGSSTMREMEDAIVGKEEDRFEYVESETSSLRKSREEEFAREFARSESVLEVIGKQVQQILEEFAQSKVIRMSTSVFTKSDLLLLTQILITIVQKHFGNITMDTKLNTNWREIVRSAVMKYVGKEIAKHQEDLLQDISDMLYDELTFRQVYRQVEESYEGEVSALRERKNSVVSELNRLEEERRGDLEKLKRDHSNRVRRGELYPHVPGLAEDASDSPSSSAMDPSEVSSELSTSEYEETSNATSADRRGYMKRAESSEAGDDDFLILPDSRDELPYSTDGFPDSTDDFPDSTDDNRDDRNDLPSIVVHDFSEEVERQAKLEEDGDTEARTPPSAKGISPKLFAKFRKEFQAVETKYKTDNSHLSTELGSGEVSEASTFDPDEDSDDGGLNNPDVVYSDSEFDVIPTPGGN